MLRQYPDPAERITVSTITPSFIIGFTFAPVPFPVLSMIVICVSAPYPLPPFMTSTENILRLLPTTINNSAPVPDPTT